MPVYNDYWEECISEAAEECGLVLTPHQLKEVAEAVMCSHDNYGMAFYSPPSSDRICAINSEWQEKYSALEKRFDAYRADAETAVKQALGQRDDANVSIGKYGEVLRCDGRITQIQ